MSPEPTAATGAFPGEAMAVLLHPQKAKGWVMLDVALPLLFQIREKLSTMSNVCHWRLRASWRNLHTNWSDPSAAQAVSRMVELGSPVLLPNLSYRSIFCSADPHRLKSE